MAKKPDPLELLRCPSGCDTRFLLYLYYEDDSEVRIATPTQDIQDDEVITTWSLGLRCSDCAKRWAVNDVPSVVKDALDKRIRDGIAEMSEIAAQLHMERGNEGG